MPFSPHMIDYTAPHVYICTRCGSDLRNILPTSSPEHVLLFQKRIDMALINPDTIFEYYRQWGVRTVTDFFLLLRDMLTLPVTLCKREKRYREWQQFLFGSKRFERFVSKSGLTFDMRGIKERESLIAIAFYLLERTPGYLLESLRHIQLTRAILHERSFPLSSKMHTLLSILPPAKERKKKVSKERPSMQKEPKTAEEIERQMASIRKFL